MQKNQPNSEPFARRARMSSNEIALAVAVTVAALAFIVAALTGGPSETASVSDQPSERVDPGLH